MLEANRPSIALVAVAVSLAMLTPATPGLAAESPTGEQLSGTLTFRDNPPTETQLSALRALGLRAQGAKRLPLAFVRGTAAQIAAALSTGAGVRFYPDEPITYASTTSNRAIGADIVHDLGFTGEGVTVAIVDGGIDATHPDLADHVVHNVTMMDQNVQDSYAVPQAPIFVAVDEGPGSNTDRNGGHGTMVAGVLAADGTTDPSQVGVAPDAELIGYTSPTPKSDALGYMAFDHILDHPEWGVDVVNNSWVSQTWSLYDPAHPMSVATKALADQGIVVVWAAGNSGAGDTEMTMNSYSVAPWIISVAGSTEAGGRYDLSSNGLMMDNSEPTPATGGHVRFTGDRIGMYHPTIAAPAGPLESSCTQPNTIALCTPGGTGTGDGTSFSAPHVAGLVALLRQARPSLSVADLRATLEATAAQPTDGSPFWQMGYGVADAPAALDLVLSENFNTDLQAAHAAADASVLADRDWRVDASEHWTWVPPVVTVGGNPDSRDLAIDVPSGTEALNVSMSYASRILPYNQVGDYTVTVFDADGREVGRKSTSSRSTVNTVLIDLRGASPAFGEWTLHVEGTLGFSDDYLDQRVTVIATLLRAQAAVAPSVSLAFTPDPARTTGVLSPEGCEIEPGEPRGTLAPPPVEGVCHSADVAATSAVLAEFTSAPLEQARLLDGEGRLVLYLSDSANLPGPFSHVIDYQLDELTADGQVLPLGAGQPFTRATDGRNEFAFELTPAAVMAGSRLRFRWYQNDLLLTSQGARYLFGGESYGDAGLTLTVGHIE